MIKMPVHAATELDDEDDITYTGEIYDDNGNSICIAELDLVDEIVKRINLHDELVAALKHVNDIMMLPENIEIEIDSLLEKCK